MGEVWRAEHRLLARQAAIKLLRPEVMGARDEQENRLMLKRFERDHNLPADGKLDSLALITLGLGPDKPGGAAGGHQ